MEIGGVSVTLALPWNYKGGLVTNGYVTLLVFPAGAIPEFFLQEINQGIRYSFAQLAAANDI